MHHLLLELLLKCVNCLLQVYFHKIPDEFIQNLVFSQSLYTGRILGQTDQFPHIFNLQFMVFVVFNLQFMVFIFWRIKKKNWLNQITRNIYVYHCVHLFFFMFVIFLVGYYHFISIFQKWVAVSAWNHQVIISFILLWLITCIVIYAIYLFIYTFEIISLQKTIRWLSSQLASAHAFYP
jgi:hypothetical protein